MATGATRQELALAAEFNQRGAAIQDEFTVKVYHDTAVVWFTLHLVGNRQGQRAELTLRYTDVWVLIDGRRWYRPRARGSPPSNAGEEPHWRRPQLGASGPDAHA
jgi:hypothetical protein